MKLSKESVKNKKKVNSEPSVKKLHWLDLLCAGFIILLTCVLYINLGRDALFDWDEGIYARLGAELLAGGNLFVPSWNGTPWFEKPPGIAWISALGQAAFGATSFGARFLQPLFAAGVLSMVYLVGTKLKSRRTGLMAAAILAGFNLFLGRTRAVNTDMPLLLGITATIAAMSYGVRPVYVAAIVAFSVWFKGLAGLMPVLIALPLFLSLGKRYILQTAVWSLIFIAPWHIAVYGAYGDAFLTPYIREQVVARVQNPIEFHLESRWFYFRYLYENLGIGVLSVAGVGAALSVYRKKYLPAWWVLLPLGLFTLAKTRLFWYILPVYPGVALACAYAVDALSEKKNVRRVIVVLAIGMCIQAVLSAWRSVEPEKKTAVSPVRIELAVEAAGYPQDNLAVLVPASERMAEAILPQSQRISSSFRYGGAPSLVYYYGRHVTYYYNLDEFAADWLAAPAPLAIADERDLAKIGVPYTVISRAGDDVLIAKEMYAQR